MEQRMVRIESLTEALSIIADKNFECIMTNRLAMEVLDNAYSHLRSEVNELTRAHRKELAA